MGKKSDLSKLKIGDPIEACNIKYNCISYFDVYDIKDNGKIYIKHWSKEL